MPNFKWSWTVRANVLDFRYCFTKKSSQILSIHHRLYNMVLKLPFLLSCEDCICKGLLLSNKLIVVSLLWINGVETNKLMFMFLFIEQFLNRVHLLFQRIWGSSQHSHSRNFSPQRTWTSKCCQTSRCGSFWSGTLLWNFHSDQAH